MIIPLAKRMEPKTLKDVLGQDELTGKGKVLQNMVKFKHPFSFILTGPPGIGKTSIAIALSNDLGMRCKVINATDSSKKDIDIAREEAKMYDGMILIIDEIHRLNKDKQDILLPMIESGLIVLIGMTTENPYHSINPAIRSRCEIFELKSLEKDDIIKGLKKAVKKELTDIKIDNKSLDLIATISGNDLRSAYNLLDICYMQNEDHKVDIDTVKIVNNKPVFFADKNGAGHYNVMSALQKSIRGSDVDAALHYTARLLAEGDLKTLERRLSVIAYEDIGMANPDIGVRLDAAINAAERVGLPEAIIPFGEIVCEMALSPKSNSSYLAINAAIDDINKGNVGEVPHHIVKGSPDYKYPHDYPNDYVYQEYLPKKLKNVKYYHPKANGYEINYKEVYDKLEKIKESHLK